MVRVSHSPPGPPRSLALSKFLRRTLATRFEGDDLTPPDPSPTALIDIAIAVWNPQMISRRLDKF